MRCAAGRSGSSRSSRAPCSPRVAGPPVVPPVVVPPASSAPVEAPDVPVVVPSCRSAAAGVPRCCTDVEQSALAGQPSAACCRCRAGWQRWRRERAPSPRCSAAVDRVIEVSASAVATVIGVDPEPVRGRQDGALGDVRVDVQVARCGEGDVARRRSSPRWSTTRIASCDTSSGRAARPRPPGWSTSRHLGPATSPDVTTAVAVPSDGPAPASARRGRRRRGPARSCGRRATTAFVPRRTSTASVLDDRVAPYGQLSVRCAVRAPSASASRASVPGSPSAFVQGSASLCSASTSGSANGVSSSCRSGWSVRSAVNRSSHARATGRPVPGHRPLRLARWPRTPGRRRWPSPRARRAAPGR